MDQVLAAGAAAVEAAAELAAGAAAAVVAVVQVGLAEETMAATERPAHPRTPLTRQSWICEVTTETEAERRKHAARALPLGKTWPLREALQLAALEPSQSLPS